MARKTLLLLVALIGLLAAFAAMVQPLLKDASIWPPDDFVEYWAAGRLNLEGKNPYSPAELLPLERFAGRDTEVAVMMWNPPWTLPLVMPLGALPAREGQFVWLLVQGGSILAAAILLWLSFGGSRESTPIAIAVAFGFVPTVFLLQVGQISGFLVLGAALFIWAIQRGYDFLAGAATVLLAVKPHLAYVLWIAIALDALSHRRYRVILGGIVVGLIASAIPMLWNPQVWHQYFAAYRDHPPAQWMSLTLGTLLRMIFGVERFWLQFVSVFLGLGWLAIQWKRYARDWNWVEQTPAILLVSFVTAPYGAWQYDLVLLLVPILQRAIVLVRQPNKTRTEVGNARFWLAAYVAANLAMLILNETRGVSDWFCWVAPFVLICYIATGRQEKPLRNAAVTA